MPQLAVLMGSGSIFLQIPMKASIECGSKFSQVLMTVYVEELKGRDVPRSRDGPTNFRIILRERLKKRI